MASLRAADACSSTAPVTMGNVSSIIVAAI
jgi:hypothetical protein